MLIYTLNQIYRFIKWSPIIWLAGFFVLNHFHFSFVISIAVLSEWKTITLGQMQTASYFFGLISALVFSSMAKIILVKQFHKYFHGLMFEKCIWCNQTNLPDEQSSKIFTSTKIIKQNLIFSSLVFLIILTVWLPIIAHHLWVDTKFESLAFLLSLSMAVIVSIFSGVAELVFTYCTAIYKLNWTSSVLFTFSFLVLKWRVVLMYIVNTNIAYALFGSIIILSFQGYNNHTPVFALLLFMAPLFQIYWLVKLHQLIVVVRAEGIISQGTPSTSPVST